MCLLCLYDLIESLVSQQGQHVGGVGVGPDLGHDREKGPGLVDQEGGADHPHADLAVQLFLLPDPVGPDGLQIGIGEQHKGQTELLGEFGVGGRAVLADADDHGVFGRKVRKGLRKGAGLPGAAGRVVLGIKVQHHFFAEKIGERDLVPLLVLQGKPRSLHAGFQHVCVLLQEKNSLIFFASLLQNEVFSPSG